ncbi:MAG: hypothetical protein H8E85_03145 [Candidatus Marinimicrobia bacterium]|nr:hypothetical protein [Candidatus Neomarinimicrobiota bacterium]
MTKHLPLQKFPIISLLIIFFISCGDEMVEDVIETYESGNKKVYVRYHPDANVLEKHFYNSAGELIHLERDSLSYGDDFQKFMIGNWILEQMLVNDEIVFEKDSIYNPDNPPNIYTFSGKKLLVSGPEYSADYKIFYLDSSQVELNGKWTYGDEGEDTYRSEQVNYDVDYFQIISYYNFVWTNFLEDPEKEEEVLFRRINIPIIAPTLDSSLVVPATPE